MAGKSNIVTGALEGLADLFAMPKVKQSMVDDALENPETLDVLGMEPQDLRDTYVDVDAAYNAIFDAPGSAAPVLEDFGDDFLDEMILFVEKGAIPKDPVAKSMVESLFDSGLKDTEARFFMDAAIPDYVKPEGGIKSVYEKVTSTSEPSKIQKPYVSSDSRAKEYRVLDSSGRVDKTFSDMESANFYLDKNYDKLMKK